MSRRPHPVVEQLRFTRSEWLRALAGVTAKDALVHHGQMNSIGWIVGHLAWQEQRYLLHRAQRLMPRRDVQKEFAFGAKMSTPAFAETLAAWREITTAADPFLDSLTTRALLRDLPTPGGKRSGQSLGSAIRRMTFHYWFHIGEIMAIRQMIGAKRLPQYVGALEQNAPYRREP
ncbi:MAG: DinB family protein [Chloroflexota bacterium]|nr:DinB family protein [Chloroflexota bacterium]MDE3192691.1 DinB family protein [Chloroflexota bacterium]